MSESAGRILMIPKGTYSPTTTYDPLDAVKYGHNSYVCKQTSRGNLPTNTTYWQPLTDVTADEIPTEDSTNLVQSGGVYSALKTLTNAFANNINENGCKNILHVINKTTANYANIIYTPNPDGSISVSNTTASAIADYYLFAPDNKNANAIIPLGNDLERNVDYILSTGRSSNAGVRLIINLYDKDRAGLGAQCETQTHTTFNLSTLDPNNLAVYYRVYLRVSSGATPVDNAVIYPMICLKSDYDLDPTYEPYAKTNQQLTQDTTGLLDNLEVNGAVNMLPNNATTQTVGSEVTFTVNSDKTITATFSEKPTLNREIQVCGEFTLNKPMTLSGCPSGGGTGGGYRLIAQDTNSKYFADLGEGTTLPSGSYNYVRAIVGSDTPASASPLVFKPMITVPSYNGPYVPYAKSNKELTEVVTNQLGDATLAGTYLSDCNNVASSGTLNLYAASPSTANSPYTTGVETSSTSFVILSRVDKNTNWGMQLAIPMTSTKGIYMRFKASETWGTWSKITP